jgi:methane/ammonia monooxygenase subunit B
MSAAEEPFIRDTTATDAAWEVERLTSFLTDVDSKFGAMLFFYDSEGRRYITTVGGPILPVFRS